jgi:O-acetyl-ADP-ribose deacetylase (regulator of RNase III)
MALKQSAPQQGEELMWKIASIVAVGALATGVGMTPSAEAAPAFSSKAPVVETTSAVQNVYYRLECHGRWHHKRCHRVWIPGHRRWSWR